MAQNKPNKVNPFLAPSSLTDDLLFPNQTDQKTLFGWTYDVNSDIFECSQSLKMFLQLNVDETLSLPQFLDRVHQDDQQRLSLQWHEAIHHLAPLFGLFRILIKDRVIWLEMKARADRHHPESIMFVGTFEDVTPTMVNEKYMEETSGEPKKNLLSTISHELRTPMNAIIGFADILDKELENSEHHVYVERIQDASNHMLSMINDILDLSKIDSGKLAIEHVSFSLQSLIQTTLKMIEPLATRKHLFLESELMNCPDYVIGDPHRIRQILINLLSNAIKFTDMGGVSLVVSAEIATEEHELLIHFRIKDTGIGMTDRQISRLFKDFEQADISTSRLYGGTGLGLSISSKLVRLMKGNIKVESQLNEGSTFHLTLPLKVAQKDADQTLDGTTLDLFRLNDTQILIAEDHQLSQMLIDHILTKLGVHVTLVENGKKAIDMAKSTPFHWILLDMEMPITNGIEAALAIRRFNQKTPILAMTANHLGEDRAKCLLAGMNDVITKPIDRNHLLKTLIAWLPELH